MTAAPPMPATQMRQHTAADLDEVTAAIAAADLTWSAELGDPPSEPRYIQALARGAMRALPNLRASRELERLRAVAGGGRCVQCGQVEALTKDGRLHQHHDTAIDELCDGSGERDYEPPNLTVRVLDNDDRKELERLRARDEAAKARTPGAGHP